MANDSLEVIQLFHFFLQVKHRFQKHSSFQVHATEQEEIVHGLLCFMFSLHP